MKTIIFIIVAGIALTGCAGQSQPRLVFIPDRLAPETPEDAWSSALYNSGNGKVLPGRPTGDRVIYRGSSGGEPRRVEAGLTGTLPGSFGLPTRVIVDEEGNPTSQLFCQTGHFPVGYSAWIPAEDTRVAPNGKQHNYLLGIGSALGQRVRFRFSNSRYDEVHPFIKSPSDGLFLEWKSNRLYAYERDQELTDDVRQLRELFRLPMANNFQTVDAPFFTDILVVTFNTGARTCSVVANGKTEVLDSRYCDPGGDSGYSLAIEASTSEQNELGINDLQFVTAFCLSTLQIFSVVRE